MPADTNRKTGTRTAPVPGSCRTAPITGRRMAAATGPTSTASSMGQDFRQNSQAHFPTENNLDIESLKRPANLPLLHCDAHERDRVMAPAPQPDLGAAPG